MTPTIEPLSLDEAFLDLTGTTRLHGEPPAILLARLVNRMKAELGITGSIGLSHNKFLAKMASDMDKPQGFSVIGRAETLDILAPKPVGVIWGLGAAGQQSLAEVGIRTIADLRRWDRDDLIRRFGSQGMRLYHLARGEDARPVARDSKTKSISNETTFSDDISEIDILDGHIWRLAEKLADRAKAKGLAGRTVTLKLKRNDFKSLTRRITLPDGTQTADRIYRTARALYDRMDHPKPYRLIGVGISDLMPAGMPTARPTSSTPTRKPAAPRRPPPTRSAPASAPTRFSRAARSGDAPRCVFILAEKLRGRRDSARGRRPHPRGFRAKARRPRQGERGDSRSAYSAASGIAPGVASIARAMTDVTMRFTWSKFPFGRIIRSFM
jgi:hypothetical protein